MRALTGASLAMTAMLALATAGCTQVGAVKAKRSFKVANQAYAQQDYKKAVQLYEETLQEDPNLNSAYFYLANSYDQQYKPSRKGDAANDGLIQNAVKNYELAADKLLASPVADDKKLGRLALDYLRESYTNPDKLNDPAKAEQIVQRMIQIDPSDPANYSALAKIYEDAGAYPEAEQMLLKAKEVKPKDAMVYMTLAGYYNRQGQFDKTIEALQQRATVEPNNPEAYQTIAAYYWDESRGDARLTDAQKRDYVQKGIESVDKALQIKPDYVEAITFKGLLLRLAANLEKDVSKQQALLKEASALSDKANDLKRQKTAGASN